MDELKSLLNTSGKGKDLTDKLLQLLDRQTDHKLSPHLLLGFLGLFNLLTIMSVIHGEAECGIKEITGSSDSGSSGESAQPLADMLSGMLKGKGAGQPDLMGLLSSVAGKKNINPNLLLSLFSMLNNQAGSAGLPGSAGSPSPSGGAGPAAASGNQDSGLPAATAQENAAPSGGETEKKNNEDRRGMELKYERKKGTGERV